jgi:hypothetical protein
LLWGQVTSSFCSKKFFDVNGVKWVKVFDNLGEMWYIECEKVVFGGMIWRCCRGTRIKCQCR